jgi:hypothetical protein
MNLRIRYELNARLKYTTLVAKRNGGFRGACTTKHPKGITLITVNFTYSQ